MRQLHYNPEPQVREYVTAALAVVVDVEPPEDLRVAVFTEALRLLAAKQVFIDAADAQPIAQPAVRLAGRTLQ